MTSAPGACDGWTVALTDNKISIELPSGKDFLKVQKAESVLTSQPTGAFDLASFFTSSEISVCKKSENAFFPLASAKIAWYMIASASIIYYMVLKA